MLCMTALAAQNLLIESRAASETEQLARCFASDCPRGAVIYLVGELGSGKSTFARALLKELGAAGPIKSPTYTLVETYALQNGLEAVHMDLYRIADPDEIDYLALDAFADKLQIMLVEWPEKGDGHLPAADILINFEYCDDARRLGVLSCSESGRQWLGEVVRAEPKQWLNKAERPIINT